MKKLIWSAAVGLMMVVGATTVLACGDKFLSLGHGARFNLATRPASVLMYLGQLDRKSTLGRKEVQSALKEAGHKLKIEDDIAKLETDVSSGKFDVVLVGYTQAVALADHVKAASTNAVILPVMDNRTKAEFAAAGKEFPYLVKSGDPSEYLVTIEKAMKSRPRI
jgi:hypothetical protein